MVTDPPLVSVIIPTYNRAQYVTEAIDSVLAQTYRNFEIIVVDDGSTDNTRQVLQARYGDRIRYLYQPNAGPAAARNRGVAEARGPYVAFLDSDDRWLPGKLEAQTEFVKRVGQDAGMTFSDAMSVDHAGHVLNESDYAEQGVFRPVQTEGVLSRVDVLVSRGFGVNTSSVLIRRDVFVDKGGFDQSLRAFEDLDLWLRVSERWKLGYQMQVLVLKRCHAGRIQLGAASAVRDGLRVYRRALQSHRRLSARGRTWAREGIAGFCTALARRLIEVGDLAGARAAAAEGLRAKVGFGLATKWVLAQTTPVVARWGIEVADAWKGLAARRSAAGVRSRMTDRMGPT